MYINMRTLVDIPDQELKLLNKLSEASDLSRAELIRRAIAAYLEPHKQSEVSEAFGLWSESPADGVAYQERIRTEWPR
jgi:metal-responsive CopG/Arc/MetJ family transcriptional regulator